MEKIILPSKSTPPFPPLLKPTFKHNPLLNLPPKSIKLPLSSIQPQSVTSSSCITTVQLKVTDTLLTQLCKNGRLVDAVSSLDDVALCGNKVKSRTFIELLQGCIDCESVELGRKVHEKIDLVDVVDLYVENKLVSMYAKCGSFDDARLVFDGMCVRNLYSWSVIIGACCREQRWREVVELFGVMVSDGVMPDGFLLPKVLQACGNSGNLEMGKMIHSLVVRTGLVESNARVCNAVLGVYVKCGRLDLAEVFFKNMAERDRVAWNSMISGYCYCGNMEEANRLFHAMHDEGVKAGSVTWNILIASYFQSGKSDVAIELMKKMNSLGVSPDVFTWTTVISGFCQNNMGAHALESLKEMICSGIEPSGVTIASSLSACAMLKIQNKTKELHLYAVKMGVARDVLVANSLIDAYSKCGDLVAARRIFDMVLKKDTYTWNSMIGGYCLAGYCGKANDLFNQMQGSNVKPNAVTWNAMIYGYIQNGDEDQAMDLFEQMESCQIKKDTASWNSLISGYLQTGQKYKAVRVFQKMQNMDIVPNAITILSLLPAFDNLVSLRKVKELHSCVFRRNLAFEVSVRNSLIDTYARAGNIVYSETIFNNMFQKDVISWNSLIGGYVLHGFYEHAIYLFDQLKAGLKPNRGTFLNIIYACSQGHRVDEGKRIFASMTEDYQITPSLEHYSAMVNLFGRSGMLREACDFIKGMPMEAEFSVLDALLTACRAQGDYVLLVKTAERLLELDPGNSSISNLLSQARMFSGKFKNTGKGRHLEKGSEFSNKPVGRCWVEAKNKMHCFSVGDPKQPYADLVYSWGQSIKDKGRADESQESRSIEEEESEETCGVHSEKLAFAYSLVGVSSVPKAIRIMKNIRMCKECHRTAKLISRTYDVKIYLNDSKCFHRFENGKCSCGDYW